MRIHAASWAAVALFAALCGAQSSLTNDAVIKMVKAGLGEDIIVSTIKTQPAQFATSADDLIALKKAGVSDRILSAMLDRGNAPAAPAASGNPLVAAAPAPVGAAAPAPAAAGPAALPPPVVSEVGVYYNKSGVWADLMPEIVNSKTGGTLKKIGTVGIVKGDVNGHVNRLHSPNELKVPIEILVYTAEGVAITEYQLLQLHEQKDSREFRTATGGVLHSSGGATRDLMPFEGKKVAPRTYLITLQSLPSGEYGLLPPVGTESAGQSGRIGKIYSFRVVQ
jgi:hypothetical protein